MCFGSELKQDYKNCIFLLRRSDLYIFSLFHSLILMTKKSSFTGFYPSWLVNCHVAKNRFYFALCLNTEVDN